MEPLQSLEANARKLARLVGQDLPKGVGFTLLLFDFGHGGHLTYVSNAERGDMLRALDEFRERMNQS